MLPTGPESETARDGLLSSRREVHVFAMGLEAGLRGEVGQLADRDDVADERWYFSGGFVVGWLIRQRWR